MTQDWWEALLLDVSTTMMFTLPCLDSILSPVLYSDYLHLQTSASKNTDALMARHPMPIQPGGIPFSRPLIPFTCNGRYGGIEGCGKGEITCSLL